MAGNTGNTLFRITTFGESHGPGLGVVIDGCPAGLPLDLAAITTQLQRRRPGQSAIVTQRKETDEFEVLSGLFEGITTGTPLCFLIRNQDQRSKDYGDIKDKFRPGHADFSYHAKYGHRDYRGGGRASARETAARVIAGAVARQILSYHGVSFVAGLVQLGRVAAVRRDWNLVAENEFNCPDSDVLEEMKSELEQARKDRDSLGGAVEVQAIGVPPGLGEPVFSKLDAAIGQAMFSIPAVKAVEIGSGVSSVAMRGSESNDEMFSDGFASNNHGGILGGISSGAPISVRLSLKPTSSIPQEKRTIDVDGNETSILTKGRHDPCVAIRAVPIAEAMLALVLVDALLQQHAQDGVRAAFSPHSLPKYGMRAGSDE